MKKIREAGFVSRMRSEQRRLETIIRTDKTKRSREINSYGLIAPVLYSFTFEILVRISRISPLIQMDLSLITSAVHASP